MTPEELLLHINKRFDTVEHGQERLEKQVGRVVQGQTRLEDGQAHLKTAVEALAAGQKDLQERVVRLEAGQEAIREEMATKADMQDVKAGVVRKLNQHEKRIDDLEKEAGIPNPHKN
jgi:predicted RNase H-like nuclease (RuvC/YqgF family)